MSTTDDEMTRAGAPHGTHGPVQQHTADELRAMTRRGAHDRRRRDRRHPHRPPPRPVPDPRHEGREARRARRGRLLPDRRTRRRRVHRLLLRGRRGSGTCPAPRRTSASTPRSSAACSPRCCCSWASGWCCGPSGSCPRKRSSRSGTTTTTHRRRQADDRGDARRRPRRHRPAAPRADPQVPRPRRRRAAHRPARRPRRRDDQEAGRPAVPHAVHARTRRCSRSRTAWCRSCTPTGARSRPTTWSRAAIVTVFPGVREEDQNGFNGLTSASSPTIIIRLRPGPEGHRPARDSPASPGRRRTRSTSRSRRSAPTPAARRRCTSSRPLACCARATSRSSTCCWTPSRCSARPPAACRKLPLDRADRRRRHGSTSTPAPTYHEAIGPGFWERP